MFALVHELMRALGSVQIIFTHYAFFCETLLQFVDYCFLSSDAIYCQHAVLFLVDEIHLFIVLFSCVV